MEKGTWLSFSKKDKFPRSSKNFGSCIILTSVRVFVVRVTNKGIAEKLIQEIMYMKL